jgi:hypothetical protein
MTQPFDRQAHAGAPDASCLFVNPGIWVMRRDVLENMLVNGMQAQ